VYTSGYEVPIVCTLCALSPGSALPLPASLCRSVHAGEGKYAQHAVGSFVAAAQQFNIRPAVRTALLPGGPPQAALAL
jgi:hypothetical protein